MNTQLTPGMIEVLDSAPDYIADFDINPENYQKLDPIENNFNCDSSNVVYVKKGYVKPFKIQFKKGVKNSTVFIGATKYGEKKTINVHGSNAIIYIGNNCIFKNTSITAATENSCFLVGSGVATQINNRWTTGTYPGKNSSSIIVGDDCMFAMGVTIRGSDGHPIFDTQTMEHLNGPKKTLIVEPYTWIGQDVTILKGVQIGACSILSLGATVTKDIPRQSLALGSPAKATPLNGKMWARSFSDEDEVKMRRYMKKYPCAHVAPVKKISIFKKLRNLTS